MILGVLNTIIVLFLFSSNSNGEDSTEKEKKTIEEYLRSIVSAESILAKRDPFVKSTPPFEVPTTEDINAINMSAPVLERYPANKYSVVATLLGDQYPRALLRLPQEEKGRVLIVKEKDKIGNNGGFVTKISKESVVVLESKKTPMGKIVTEEIQLRFSAPAK